MEKGTHGINELKFSELSYADQAKSINAQILSLERALNAHLVEGANQEKEIKETAKKYKTQLERLTKKLNNI